MRLLLLFSLTLLLTGIFSCEVNNEVPNPDDNPEFFNWLIPKNEIINRGTPDDAIPAIDNPLHLSVTKVTYLDDNELVLGVSNGVEHHAYPVKIMNYHEVVNDEYNINQFQISYCPLTGSGNSWFRNNMSGITTTFGVSEFIYNSNHILYDRATRSNWLPMQSKSVNGEFEGFKPETQMVIEITWSKWKEMFPGSEILSIITGGSFNYETDPYENYKSTEELNFPVSPEDKILPAKEKVLGIIVNDRAKVYRLKSVANDLSIILDNHQGLSVVVIGSKTNQFLIAFERRFEGSIELEFEPNSDAPNIIMADNLGNKYDIFGLIVDGPNKGQSLNHINYISGYWFAIAAMYPDPLVYE